MTDDTDKPDKPVDENENLVKALESIKSLLATSETKLSQARESISQASAHSLKMTSEVPVLDDVIVPGKAIEPAGKTAKTPAQDKSKAATSVDLQAFRAELENDMHDKLKEFAQQLEFELKQKISDHLAQYSKPHDDK